MPIQFVLTRKVPARAEMLVVGVTKEMAADESGDLDWPVLGAGGFEATLGQTAVLAGDAVPTLVVGMGPIDVIDAGVFRQAGAAIARATRKRKRLAATVLDLAPKSLGRAAAAGALAEGVVLGSYSYDEYKSDAKPSVLASVSIVGGGGAAVTEALGRGAIIGQAVNVARDLVNEPGGSLTPTRFAQQATRLTRGSRIKAKVLDQAAIKRARLGGLLGVSRGSTQQPRFVELSYTPTEEPSGHLALVGKGITFDAGGLSIKTGSGMMTMKCDMGGAAAVVGAMSALSDLAPAAKVSAYLPLTDNMLGGDATRPGDVLTIRNKKTVEVLNTDAEGRLVLADALALASEAGPDAIVDVATLTGACMVALGPEIAALMANDDTWRAAVEAAATRTGELIWPLPLPTEYRKMLDSTVADVKNIGGAHGGALTAGLFLQEFVGDGLPWAHIDIAGPAFADTQGTDHPKGGTGFGVRLLIDLVENFEPPAPVNG